MPDLFYIKCANILWKDTRQSGYPMEKARKALTDLGKLAFPVRRLALPGLPGNGSGHFGQA